MTGAAPSIILLYHQVADLDGDPQRLAVSPAHFAEHLHVIRTLASPMRLLDVLDRTEALDARPRVVLTFDDGYADSFTHARPLLESHDVPATVFVTSGQVGADREFWWDELDQVVLRAPSLPAKLQLRIGADVLRWRTRASGAASAFEAYPRWTIDQPDHDERHTLYRTLCDAFRRCDAATRRQALDDLAAWAGVSPTVRTDRRTMTPDELRSLAAQDLVEVGAHTVTHTMLSVLPPAEQRREVTESKGSLEAVIGRPVRSFSYPFGMRTSYSADTVTAVRDAGFACACSNFEGLVDGRTARLELPRLIVRDWDGDAFAERLRGWLGEGFGAVRKATLTSGSVANTVV